VRRRFENSRLESVQSLNQPIWGRLGRLFAPKSWAAASAQRTESRKRCSFQRRERGRAKWIRRDAAHRWFLRLKVCSLQQHSWEIVLRLASTGCEPERQLDSGKTVRRNTKRIGRLRKIWKSKRKRAFWKQPLETRILTRARKNVWRTWKSSTLRHCRCSSRRRRGHSTAQS